MTRGQQGTPTHTVHQVLSRMKRGKGESVADFARRKYYMQMEIYSSYAGRDLDTDFDLLPAKVQADWIRSAKK